MDHPEVARMWAQDAATAPAPAIGMKQHAQCWEAVTEAAKLILPNPEEEEAHERDLVDDAKLDRSVIDQSDD